MLVSGIYYRQGFVCIEYNGYGTATVTLDGWGIDEISIISTTEEEFYEECNVYLTSERYNESKQRFYE